VHFPFSNSCPAVCISHFLLFQYSSPYLTSYDECFSFSMIFSFLTIFWDLQCAFRIFHVFSVS
jgi:hypothetical protein